MKSSMRLGLAAFAFLLAGCCDKNNSCPKKKESPCAIAKKQRACKIAKKAKKAVTCKKVVTKVCRAKVKKESGTCSICFCFDRHCLTDNSKHELDKVIRWMKNHKHSSVLLEGHSDSRGNAAYNMKLSEKRVMSAVDYIVNHGIDKSRITTKCHGESKLPGGSSHEGNRVVTITKYVLK